MTLPTARLDRARNPAGGYLCDAWVLDSCRVGEGLPGLALEPVNGRWPGFREMDAVTRLADTVGEGASWDRFTETPPVAQKLAERARLQPLDLAILSDLHHLQHVCWRPWLNLRVEEDRVPVSRARRTPVRAVADLVSHPGAWENRTLRDIRPSRVLSRLMEDEWDLYENRVAVRLVDHLLPYLADRLEELREIMKILDESRDYSDLVSRTSFWRAERISRLWSQTLDSSTEDELQATLRRLDHAYRDLQALLDAPLYHRVARNSHLQLELRPTNILVNDRHYRKVAALWRAWVKFGHRHQESTKERIDRRQREAKAWDQFVLHLVARAFSALGWKARSGADGLHLDRPGWQPLRIAQDAHGVVQVQGGTVRLRLLPLCADLSCAAPDFVVGFLKNLDDPDEETVVVHAGPTLDLSDLDRAKGWSLRHQAVLFGCSPWKIDSEERMTRLVHGWINRSATHPYPCQVRVMELPDLPPGLDWMTYHSPWLTALRAPSDQEHDRIDTWIEEELHKQEALERQANLARKPFPLAPKNALVSLRPFLDGAIPILQGLSTCPVCGEAGRVEPRLDENPEGSSATWWAECPSCGSKWGLRPCTHCGKRYRVLLAEYGALNLPRLAAETPPKEWPDRVLGADVWAQPCAHGWVGPFRCPECGVCPEGECSSCRAAQAPAGGEGGGRGGR